MKPCLVASLAALTLTACATGPAPYTAATSDSARGYSALAIENDRFRVAYRAKDPVTARDYALLRAAEITRDSGADWFRVTSAYTEQDGARGGNSSVSVGGSTGSYGSGVGVGIGIGLGGGNSNEAVHVLEILTGSGPAPDSADVYEADAVIASIGAAALGGR